MILACDNRYLRQTQRSIIDVYKDFTITDSVDLFTVIISILTMAMTKRTDVDGKIVGHGKLRGAKTLPKQCSPTNNKQAGPIIQPKPSPVKNSPPRSPVPPSSPRSSPGLVSGYYAGCKFTEPPSASALPLPPQHWMKSNRLARVLPFPAMSVPCAFDHHHDFTQQLKLLLKVQA